MGLVGPNGAGKTTIIRLIMNLLRRDAGEIRIFEKDNIIHNVEIKERIGFVYENPPFYPQMSLQDVKRITSPFYPGWDEKCFLRLTERFKLPLKKKIKALSKGMVLKAALALALSHNAELLVLDEPTSGLDPVFRRELLELLRGIMQDENKSILFSTHIVTDLEGIADFITMVSDGKIIFCEERDRIYEQYALIRGSSESLQRILAAGDGMVIRPRETRVGFEALSRKADEIRNLLAEAVVIERPGLEDIMFYLSKEGEDER
jgi:ABC-2 type transport system ATP-binding protein